MPKDQVMESQGLSAILRNELRGFELDLFPKELMQKNEGLEGTVVITHSRTYGPADKTRAGLPKEGWRLIFLEGCPLFLAKLAQFPESHRFEFCSSRIQIWGGTRKEEALTPRSGPPGRGNSQNGGRQKSKNATNHAAGGNHRQQQPPP